jgi:hypothetical protein
MWNANSRALAIALVLAASTACTPVQPASDKTEAQRLRLSETMLRAIFPANMDAMSQRVGPSTLTMRRDGTFAYRLFGPNFDDKGKWRIQGDQLCLQYEFIGGGKEQCRSVYQIQPGRYLIWNEDGSEEIAFTVWSEPSAAPKP